MKLTFNCVLFYDKKTLMPTKCIYHKGFSGYSSVVARSNFRVGDRKLPRNPLLYIHSTVSGQAKTTAKTHNGEAENRLE